MSEAPRKRDLPRTVALLSIGALAITITVALLITGWRTWREEVKAQDRLNVAQQEQIRHSAYQTQVNAFESECWSESEKVGYVGRVVRGTWYEHAIPTFSGETHTCEWARTRWPAYLGYDRYCSEDHPDVAACFIMPSREIPEP